MGAKAKQQQKNERGRAPASRGADKGTMLDTEAFREFKKGIEQLKLQNPRKALPFIRRAVELEKSNPFYLSHLGLVLAQTQHKWHKAQEICVTALRMRRNEAQLYLNLAEVYRLAGRNEDAAETLTRGLPYAPRDARLIRALSRVRPRREPLFSFLARKHFLNRSFGKLFHRALKVLAARAHPPHAPSPGRDVSSASRPGAGLLRLNIAGDTQ